MAAGLTSSDVLLGIMSGGAARRAAARCVLGRMHWDASALATTLSPVRVLFIVGENGEPGYQSSDVLRVPVHERVVKSSFSTMGTAAVLLKLVHFLRYAATQPENAIAVADDDTFISLPRLHSIASVLMSKHARFYAGSFEWYNFIPATFQATGWGSGPQRAAYDGTRLANCTRDGSMTHAGYDGSHSNVCIGPLVFAKGYFFMMARSVAVELASHPDVRRDFGRAQSLGSV